MIRVLLVDAEGLVLDGLAALLQREDDVEVIAAVSTVDAAADAAAARPPDVVVLDPDLGGEDGLALLQRLAASEPRPRTLALTAADEPEMLRHALTAGVDGYVLKRARYEEVVEAIRETAAGETVISPQFVFRLVDRPAGETAPVPRLTARERQVLERISEGRTNAEIARRAGISVRTVQKHVENLFHKLGVHGRAELIAEAFRRGLVA